MKTIHKFPLAPPFILMIPSDAKILSVQAVNNAPFVWVELDTDSIYIKRNLMVLGTGHPFPEHVSEDAYIGSVQLDNGEIIIHVYEELATNVH